MIKCEALKFTQGGKVFYLCLIKAKELLSDYAIDAYDSVENEDGYQRSFQMPRARKFADYLLKCNGAFNSTCLLNVRKEKECKFKPGKKSSTNPIRGMLEINKSLYVVDGQHRIKGLEIATKEGFSKEALVPAFITIGNQKHVEALSFLIINRTAKGIKADLTDELIFRTIKREQLTDDLKMVLGLTIERNMGEFALNIAKRMNESKDNYWFNKMILPNESKTVEKSVNQRIFSQSMVDAIKSCGLLKRSMNIGDIDSVYGWLKDYWQAIAAVCPKATSVKDWRKYALIRTTGVSVMNKLFGRILDDVGQEPSTTKFAESLAKMPSLDDQAWNLNTGEFGKLGTSKKALGVIYTKLEIELDTSSVR